MIEPLSKDPDCNPECRACHYKEIAYGEQLARKQRWADEQLGAWAGVLQPIVPAPEAERVGYRSKSWLRSAVVGGEVSFGMTRAVRLDSKGGKWDEEFVSWDRCPIHVEAIRVMIGRLKQVLKSAPRLVEEALVGAWMGSPHLVIVAREDAYEEIRALPWKEVLEPPFERVWFHYNRQVGKRVFGHLPVQPLDGGAPDSSAHPIRAFRQVAGTLLRQARAQAMQALLADKPAQLVDLYCGTGDLSLLLPAHVAWLGIEYSKEAITYASRLRAGEGHLAYVGGVEQRLRDPRVLERIADRPALYLNPPRSGLSGEASDAVLDLVREKRPRAISYLSCSASSLKRDLPGFEKLGYRVERLQPWDFFPQTEHFETLALLSSR